MGKEYYPVRRGHIEKDELLSLKYFKVAFLLVFKNFEDRGYFKKYFGDEYRTGLLGYYIDEFLLLETGIRDLWTVEERLQFYSEVDLMTMIEVLYNYASKYDNSIEGNYDPDLYYQIHFSDDLGKKDFREGINPILKKYRNAELSESGEILESSEEGFEPMFIAPIVTENEEIKLKINTAIKKFRRAVSTIGDKKDALRDLADVLEFLRPDMKKIGMSKDTSHLFNIANNFGIRHFNAEQKTEYDTGIWHSWMFYCYLATIHACLHLIEEQKKEIL